MKTAKTLKTAAPKLDVYTRVTEKIIASLEAGTRPWQKPWSAPESSGRGVMPLRANGTPYRGINVLLLWGEAMDKGYNRNTWMTYKQAEGFGAQVRKGEKGSMVVYADRATTTETDDKGEKVERAFAFMKAYTVFNVEQIDGLPERFLVTQAEPAQDKLQMFAAAEAFFERTGAKFRHGGNRAFYTTGGDFIQLPPLQAFCDAESYTATKAHELIHWTGHSARMAREFGKRFGDQAYAFEELVAELGSAFLCAGLGITPDVREDHAAYLASWLRVLKEDKRAIFSAAAHAQRAADFLEGLQERGEVSAEQLEPA
ncbi:zincin-like metallopeptidase domain-containing protein [Variovorax sp. H27-G14]|uniref:ArdC family protein n=1 Tax=Variovorax sp. H27-G14 TaxID=3111914 RepID=UPI0038FC805C